MSKFDELFRDDIINIQLVVKFYSVRSTVLVRESFGDSVNIKVQNCGSLAKKVVNIIKWALDYHELLKLAGLVCDCEFL